MRKPEHSYDLVVIFFGEPLRCNELFKVVYLTAGPARCAVCGSITPPPPQGGGGRGGGRTEPIPPGPTAMQPNDGRATQCAARRHNIVNNEWWRVGYSTELKAGPRGRGRSLLGIPRCRSTWCAPPRRTCHRIGQTNVWPWGSIFLWIPYLCCIVICGIFCLKYQMPVVYLGHAMAQNIISDYHMF